MVAWREGVATRRFRFHMEHGATVERVSTAAAQRTERICATAASMREWTSAASSRSSGSQAAAMRDLPLPRRASYAQLRLAQRETADVFPWRAQRATHG